ncbi:MAG: 2-oxo acid dehydrogenase subunit E2 [Lentisphaeria bacterium]|nr:2-oxo acid dehydrogenase subunit E2 [Lentisphaeria bacterium]
MSQEIKVPSVGEGIDSVDIVEVLVEPGQKVNVEDPLIEVESDKAAAEIPSPVAGIVDKILVQAGDTAAVGQVFMTLTVGNGASAAAEPAAAAASAPEPEAPAPVVESAKPATPPAAAPPPPASRPAAPLPSRSDGKSVPASPAVRRFAREIGIDVAQVPGSDEAGRISIEDVKAYSRSVNAGGQTAPAGAPAARALPDFTRLGSVRSEPMSGIRKATATHMSYCWSTIPHVAQFDQADITELEPQRKRFSKPVEAAGGKLTITAIVIKVLAAALKKFPQFNVSVDMANQSIVYKDYFNIGVAVDTDRGLLVPVIRDVDAKSIVDLAIELGQAAERARDRQLGAEEMQGGCMTVTNLGGIGGIGFTPIVNWPEVAILGVARGSMQQVWRNDSFQPRLILPLSLSYDHRVIDGADGARFLRWIAEALENPFVISLEG